MLPDPTGSLSSLIPLSSIDEINKSVLPVIMAKSEQQSKAQGKKRRLYCTFTDTERCEIVKRAAEFGVTSTIQHFKKTLPPGKELKEITVRTWVKLYKKVLSKE